MYTKEFYVSSLIAAKVRGELNDIQQQELDHWISLSERNRQLFLSLTNGETLQPKLSKYARGNVRAAWDRTQMLINRDQKREKKSKVFQVWPHYAMIAALIVTVLVGLFLYRPGHDAAKDPIHLSAKYRNDVAPGKNTATLSVNGRLIQLSDAKTGVVIADGIKYSDGSLVQNVSEVANEMLAATTPRGGTYQFTLQDGTKVWLNADSKLEFFADYTNKTKRIVRLVGEGYFEVVKDTKRPFIVESDGQRVEVLGTHFNVNTYSNEPIATTTLLEGSVRVSNAAGAQVIKPGQQVINDGSSLKINDVDVECITDWKTGDFNLNGMDFKTAMRKIARWYNVEIVYENDDFNDLESGGWVSRDKNLSQVLNAIEATGLAHFDLEGRKVHVYK